jgi:pimeloyl-ACP methyl ester carboxylesterase
MLLTWLMLLGFELLRAHSQMIGKRRMSMKNEKELTLLVTGTSTRRAREKEKSYVSLLVGIFLVAILLVTSKERLMSQTNQEQKVRNVVLVHGGLVDGSGWEGVYNALKTSRYAVTVVQEATASFTDDVATTKRAIAQQNGPVILVGHSYGGAVITEAGNDPKVAGLVYISAFAPDKGESVSTLIKNPPSGAPVLPILPPVDGYLLFDKAKFPAFFAGDLSPKKAAFMADSQVPWGVNALNGTISEPAWKAKPSWYLLTTEDKMIPPGAQRQMAKRAGAVIVEVKGSHSTYVSHPQAVATLIEEAAKGALLVPAR